MNIQIQPEGKDYVVSIFFCLPGDRLQRWWPIRKLASQGDAFLYRDIDAPKLTDRQIVLLIKRYDERKTFRREHGGKRFTRVFG